jgi:RNA polymerase primary sigma factor
MARPPVRPTAAIKTGKDSVVPPEVEPVEAAGAEPPETTDGPIIDLNDAAVKRLLKVAKARGYVTLDELNAVLPSEEVTSDQIEDVYAMFAEMGITVVESEEDTEVAKVEENLHQIARTILFACICAKWAQLNFSPAKAKLRLLSALKLAAKR